MENDKKTKYLIINWKQTLLQAMLPLLSLLPVMYGTYQAIFIIKQLPLEQQVFPLCFVMASVLFFANRLTYIELIYDEKLMSVQK
jgi:hypothetical protein